MKKKFLAVMLATMMLVISACGSNSSDVNGKVVSQSAEADKQTEAGESSAETKADGEAGGSAEAQSGEQAASTESSPAEADEEFSVGENQGTYYENTYFGIRYTPTNGVELQDEEYIQQLNAAMAEYLDDDSEVKKALDNGTVVTVAAAANADGTMNSNIGIQNASLMANFVSEETLIDASIDATQKQLDSLGMFDSVEVTKETVHFLGADHYCIAAHSVISGVDFYQKIAVLVKGKYAMMITASGFGEDDPQTILNDVSAIE